MLFIPEVNGAKEVQLQNRLPYYYGNSMAIFLAKMVTSADHDG
jgi:hypothetical protein